MAENRDWKIETADDVAQALDWLRRRMNGKGLVLIAVGVNSVAICKDTGVTPEDAAALIEQQQPALRTAFNSLKERKVTRGYYARKDV